MDFDFLRESIIRQEMDVRGIYFWYLVNDVDVSDEEQIVIIKTDEKPIRNEDMYFVFKINWNGINFEKMFPETAKELFYDIEQEEFYSKEELFEIWKDNLQDENESFSNYIKNATSKNGTLESIYKV